MWTLWTSTDLYATCVCLCFVFDVAFENASYCCDAGLSGELLQYQMVTCSLAAYMQQRQQEPKTKKMK
eukprot:m.42592 g.42592  ORF g.42592 m.42592 type:complete len:68 (+) comp11949_c0_seq2:362-565(+)